MLITNAAGVPFGFGPRDLSDTDLQADIAFHEMRLDALRKEWERRHPKPIISHQSESGK